MATNGDNFATSRTEICHHISNLDVPIFSRRKRTSFIELAMDSWRVQGRPHMENSRIMHVVIMGSSDNIMLNVYARIEKDENHSWTVTTLVPIDYSTQDE